MDGLGTLGQRNAKAGEEKVNLEYSLPVNHDGFGKTRALSQSGWAVEMIDRIVEAMIAINIVGRPIEVNDLAFLS